MAKNRFVALVALAVLSLGLVTTVSVYAQDGTGDTTTNQTTESTSPNSGSGDGTTSTSVREAEQAAAEKAHQAAEAAHEAAQKEVEAAKDKVTAAEDKLQGARLQSCQAHQDAIKKIMTQAGERGDRQINLFDTIAARVEAFYTSKGKVLANYDQLVASVGTAKTAAQTAVTAVKSANTQFDCSGTNPTSQVAVLRAELKAMSTALEQYRTAVKNLIVGVKSVQSTTTSTNGAQ